MSEANMFIFVNLGCEMLYVIDQRLKAQEVETDKSIQVINDITNVLLNPKYIQKLLNVNNEHSLINQSNFKKILYETACCSLMRLEEPSMSKLWDLMLMVFKWQISISPHSQHLIDVTFRHLDGISMFYPDVQKTVLIDYTKDIILDYWNSIEETKQTCIFNTTKEWLSNMNTKISILLRLGFQNSDGTLIDDVKELYLQEFIKGAGENIYYKTKEFTEAEKNKEQHQIKSNQWTDFANELNFLSLTKNQHNINKNNIIFEKLTIEVQELNDNVEADNCINENQQSQKFVQIPQMHTPKNSWENFIGQNKNTLSSLKLKDFLTDNSENNLN
ncbi:protein OSCP1 [Condylostylus longicornis]|uniref:protein OSCP1 n=1 Tax=Condylostylus longicornis TaxID=2530218 RepID=UPI00244DA66C|nr:protein OSCP1 [Condylostylus longicornis]